MGVKAVEMVRKIRDKNFEETKRLSMEKQVNFVKRKAEELRKKLKIEQHPSKVIAPIQPKSKHLWF